MFHFMTTNHVVSVREHTCCTNASFKRDHDTTFSAEMASHPPEVTDMLSGAHFIPRWQKWNSINQRSSSE